MSDLVEVEVTRLYTKSTTIVVPRNGRTDDQLLAAYESDIETGLNSASIRGGEDNFDFRESTDGVHIEVPTVNAFIIRVKENGKFIGTDPEDPEGYPSCVDKLPSFVKPFKTRESAEETIRSIAGLVLYNLGTVSDFTLEVVPLTIGG
jgi:hypothetical protein